MSEARRTRRANATDREVSKFSTWLERNVVHFARAICDAEGKGTTGQERLKIAAKAIAAEVDIPFFPEVAERFIFKLILTAFVRLAQALFGKARWFDRLERMVTAGGCNHV